MKSQALDIFKKQTEELSSLLEDEGLAVRPYAYPSLSFFQQLDEGDQKRISEGLRDYILTAKAVRGEGQSLKNSALLARKALKSFGLTASPEFERRLQDFPGVIEFYAPSGHQLFRTFNYFEMTSYTLEDIYCRAWSTLYERPEEITRKIFEDVDSLLKKGDSNEVVLVGPHIIKERVSLERLQLQCRSMQILLLKKEQQPAGVGILMDGGLLERADG